MLPPASARFGDSAMDKNCVTCSREPPSRAFGSSQAASRSAASTRNILAYRSRPANWASCPATSNARFGSEADFSPSLTRGPLYPESGNSGHHGRSALCHLADLCSAAKRSAILVEHFEEARVLRLHSGDRGKPHEEISCRARGGDYRGRGSGHAHHGGCAVEGLGPSAWRLRRRRARLKRICAALLGVSVLQLRVWSLLRLRLSGVLRL